MVQFLKEKKYGSSNEGGNEAKGRYYIRGQTIIHNPGCTSASHRGAIITRQYWVTTPGKQTPPTHVKLCADRVKNGKESYGATGQGSEVNGVGSYASSHGESGQAL